MMDVPKDKRRDVFGTVMVDPQLSKILAAAAYAEKNHLANYGTIGHSLDWGLPLPNSDKIVLIDCTDQSRFGTMDTKLNTPLTAGGERVRLDATFINSEGKWKVVGIVEHGNSKC